MTLPEDSWACELPETKSIAQVIGVTKTGPWVLGWLPEYGVEAWFRLEELTGEAQALGALLLQEREKGTSKCY